MELPTYLSITPVNKPCLICGATVQVPMLHGDNTQMICSECYKAIAWAKEKMQEEDNG